MRAYEGNAAAGYDVSVSHVKFLNRAAKDSRYQRRFLSQYSMRILGVIVDQRSFILLMKGKAFQTCAEYADQRREKRGCIEKGCLDQTIVYKLNTIRLQE